MYNQFLHRRGGHAPKNQALAWCSIHIIMLEMLIGKKEKNHNIFFLSLVAMVIHSGGKYFNFDILSDDPSHGVTFKLIKIDFGACL